MDMIDEIVELLPSKDLKAKIRESGYAFSELDLLQIIYGFAPSFEKRLVLLERFARVSSPEIARCVELYSEWQMRLFQLFCEESDGYIYELHIKEQPDAYDERYICSSYEAALKYIDLYYGEYGDVGSEESEKTRYKIVKRRIYTGDEAQGFCEDEMAVCVLGAHKTVLSVSDTRQWTPYDDYKGECDGDCMDCTKVCPWRADEILFPCFTHDRDAVSYTDHDGNTHFGICFQKDESPMDYLYIIPLDSNALRYHAFDEDLQAHEHIFAPLVEVVPLGALDEKMRADYWAYLKHLDLKSK